MSPVLNALLCGLVGSLLVSGVLLASLIYTAREYLLEKTYQLRRKQFNDPQDPKH